MSKKIVIIQATFHQDEMKVMLDTAQETARYLGLEVSKVISVPGSMEIPLALSKNIYGSDIVGGVVLGIIERGETKHGLVMGQTVIASIIDMQLKACKPIGVGILGPEIFPSQIPPRLVPYAKAAVEATYKMLSVE